MGLVRDTQGTWSWEALGAALLLLLVPVQLSMSYLTRNKYDFHKIPKSPGGTPILGSYVAPYRVVQILSGSQEQCGTAKTMPCKLLCISKLPCKLLCISKLAHM